MPIETSLNRELRKMFQDIRDQDVDVTCRHPNCPFSSKRERVMEHERACAHAEVRCRHPDCSFSSTRENVAEHERDCTYALVPCVWCNEEVPLACIERHWQVHN